MLLLAGVYLALSIIVKLKDYIINNNNNNNNKFILKIEVDDFKL